MVFAKKILTFIRSQQWSLNRSVVILGVSGGPDSVAMAHVLSEIRHDIGVPLMLAHYNHRIRPTSDEDERFVRNLANTLAIPIEVKRHPKSMVNTHVSEQTARQWRLAFFAAMVARHRSQGVMLAHTQDDCAETILLHLFRGSGLGGLRGIMPRSDLEGLCVLRPLLSSTRAQIISYLKSIKSSYCVDETNAQDVYQRNKVRLNLLPKLRKEFNPGIDSVLLDLAQTATVDYDFILAHATETFKQNIVKTPSLIKIKIDILLKVHPALRRMILRLCYNHRKGDFNALQASHILDAEKIILENSSQTKQLHWPADIVITITPQWVICR